jgi:T5SS/PEP-CTERM-associated repeat protein
MFCRFKADSAHGWLSSGRRGLPGYGKAAAATFVIILVIAPQSLFAGLSFSGDVSLNTGIPNAPVMVGRQTVGSLQLDNGTVFTSGPTQFGTTPTGIGTGLVTGFRTMWTMSTTDVGLAGIGRLDIEAGAVVDTSRMVIGAQPNSNGAVRVRGAGSTLQVRGPLTVGGVGTLPAVGLLEILDGAIANATQTSTTIGRNGRVHLDGGLLRLSTFMNEGLISGSGEVHVISTASINHPGRLEAGQDDHLLINGTGTPIQNVGTISVDGGEIEIVRAVINASQGSFFRGEVKLRNGTMRIGASMPEGTQPQLTNMGLLAAIGGENHFYGRVQVPTGPPTLNPEIAVTNNSTMIFHDDVTLQGGMFTVFAGSKATLLEDLALTSGSLLLADISGSSIDTGYGEIEVVGNVSLGGSVRAAVSTGYTPAAGDSFPIIKALGGVTGTLTLSDMPPLPDRLMWDLDVTAHQVALNVVQAPPGDYNTDGIVDAADYVVWRQTQGQTGPGQAADGNSDGVVDAADYDFWRANFGSVVGGASASGPVAMALAASVPEPTTLILIGLASFVFPRCVTRRTSV